VARASKRSKEQDVRKTFDDISDGKSEVLTVTELQSYLGDYLGFGQPEIAAFLQKHGSSSHAGGVSFEGFRAGYASLNPYMIQDRRNEVIIRKPGSIKDSRSI